MLPFGLGNAPAAFMILMNSVFEDCLDDFILIFIDDILIYFISIEEHNKHLMIFFQRLREHKLYGKLSKCTFFQKKIHYLGHIIFEDEVFVDLEKIKAIIAWPVP